MMVNKVVAMQLMERIEREAPQWRAKVVQDPTSRVELDNFHVEIRVPGLDYPVVIRDEAAWERRKQML